MEKDFLETKNSEETFNLGKMMGEQAKPQDVICLDGELGSGKTVFTQGFAAGLGIKDIVTSPTFTILMEYHDGRIPMYHFDVYRISDDEEMDEIGYYDKLYGDGVCLIEWSSIIKNILPEHYTRVVIGKDIKQGFDYRKITIEKV